MNPDFFGREPIDLNFLYKYLLPAKEVCKGYVFTHVCLSTGWGSCMAGEGMHGGGCMARGYGRGHAWQGACVAGGECMAGVCMAEEGVYMACTPSLQILRDTVNEWAVSILLECILVVILLHTYRCTLQRKCCTGDLCNNEYFNPDGATSLHWNLGLAAAVVMAIFYNLRQ